MKNDFSDSEIIEATKIFYANCGFASQELANISSDSISTLEMKAIIEGDSVAEFIANQARQIVQSMNENKLSSNYQN